MSAIPESNSPPTPMFMDPPGPSEELLVRIADLAEELVSWPDPQVAERAMELLDGVDLVHRSALRALLDLIEAHGGDELVKQACSHDAVRILVAAYEMDGECDNTEAIGERVEVVVSSLRALLQLHGGEVDMVGLSDRDLMLRLRGTCTTCPSAHAILRSGIEELMQKSQLDLALVLFPSDIEIDPAKADLICGIPTDVVDFISSIPVMLGPTRRSEPTMCNPQLSHSDPGVVSAAFEVRLNSTKER